ncbi:MAG: hypothetical protein GX871_07530, partial [Microbacteriaceae bacterium]|nr:hypothetical protein [Microbacteriaceae bacterium]
MVTRERAYGRLLRWYPRAWRAEHGPALLGTMLDAAEAEGREHPSGAERRSAAMHGLGMRLDDRVALAAALAAIVVAAVGSGLFLPLGAVSIVAASAVPWLTAVAFIALLRMRGLLAPPRAVATLSVTTLALALAFAASASWSVAFDAADAGLPGTWFSSLWLAWFVAAWLVGASAIALLADGLLAAARVPTLARIGAGAVGGLVAAPIIGVSLVAPGLQAAVAFGTLLLVVRVGARRAPSGSAAAGAGRAPSPRAPRSPGARRAARLLSWLACGVALAGAAYAFTGPSWGWGADGTRAMADGIAVLT